MAFGLIENERLGIEVLCVHCAFSVFFVGYFNHKGLKESTKKHQFFCIKLLKVSFL